LVRFPIATLTADHGLILALAFTGLIAAMEAGLIEQDEESLYQELGARVRAMTVNPALGGPFDPCLPAIKTLGPIDEIRSLGRRDFKHVSKETYQVACGDDPEYADERRKFEAAFALGKRLQLPPWQCS
jgi:hypothetical protein